MELKPLYELRERLRAGAIAGAALAADDFRLRRALEALAPLEKAAPVFQKLGDLCREALSPDCKNRAGALLDALSLCDAVLCTQGAVAAPQPVAPLPKYSGGAALTNAPYSVLSPLLEALTTSGGGRYGFVVDTHNARPELFEDYRVKEALVKALGASYSELAELAEQWLSRESEAILPLLQRDFDPRGKREMVRRIHVMEKISGAGANSFFLLALPQSEKEVRSALILALQHTEENAKKLIELCKTEKGSCKKAAHWALARLESPAAWEYWEALSAKKPEQAAQYMVLSASQKASALIGGALLEAIAPFEEAPDAPISKEAAQRLQSLLYALPAKSGKEVCSFWRRAAALGEALDRPVTGEKNDLLWKTSELEGTRYALPFSRMLPKLLIHSLLCNPSPDLVRLARGLYQDYGAAYAAPALVAAFITRPADECYELARPYLAPKAGLIPTGRLFHRKGKENQEVLQDSLGRIQWDEEQKKQVLYLNVWDPAREGTMSCRTVPLFENLDRRFYEDLFRLGKGANCDPILLGLIPGPAAGAELADYIGRELYRRSRLVDDNRSFLEPLKRCGWPECEGIMESYCRRHRISTWEFQSYASRLPGSREAAGAEAARVLRLIQKKEIPVSHWNPTPLPQWLREQFGVEVEL